MMINRFKKCIIIFGIFLSIFLMVSSSTAVPQTQSKQVKKIIEEKEVEKIDNNIKKPNNLEQIKLSIMGELENLKESKATPILDFLINLIEMMGPPEPEGGFLYMVFSICLNLLYSIREIWGEKGGISGLFQIFIDVLQFYVGLLLIIPVFIFRMIWEGFKLVIGFFMLIFAVFLSIILWILEMIFGEAILQ